MYSTHKEGTSVIAEKFIRNLKNKFINTKHQYQENMCIDKLDDLVSNHNNTDHSTIKQKPVDVKSCTYLDSSKEINDKNHKFKIGDIVRISKYKNIFATGYLPNWSEKIFVIKKVKNTVPWTYVMSDLNREEIVGTFYGKQLQNIQLI